MENYGIAYDGPIPTEISHVDVPSTSNLQDMAQEETILQIVEKDSTLFGVDLYQELVQLLRNN